MHSQQPEKERKRMEKVTYTVPNISCGHCVHTIHNELMDLSGVKSVQASEGTKIVVVEFDAPATKELIETTLEEINYPVAK
jgi:copper chaperone CopZ